MSMKAYGHSLGFAPQKRDEKHLAHTASLGASEAAQKGVTGLRGRLVAGLLCAALFMGGGSGILTAARAEPSDYDILLIEPERTESKRSGSGLLEADNHFSEASRPYLDILRKKRNHLVTYDWQNMAFDVIEHQIDLDMTEEPTPIAFADLCGDSTPEMILIETTGDAYGGSYDTTALRIVSFEGGRARTLCSEPWDYMYGGGFHYVLFQLQGEKTLYAWVHEGDEWQRDVYLRFSANSDGTLFAEEILMHEVIKDDDVNYHETWTQGDAEITQEAYTSLENQMVSRARAFLIRSRYDAPVFYDKIRALGTMAMTYSQAEAYLTSLLDAEEDLATTDEAVFSRLEDTRFIYSIGAGAWSTEFTMGKDGRFVGCYSDSEMGDAGENYPDGTVYLSNFHGRFGNVQKIDDYTYTLDLVELDYDEPLEMVYQDGVRIIPDSAYGLEIGKKHTLYLPDSLVEHLPAGYVECVSIPNAWSENPILLPFYGLYNAEDAYGFFSTMKDPSQVNRINVRFDNTRSVDLNWGWGLFEQDASKPNEDLALAGCILSQAAEMGQGEAEARLKELGFENVYSVFYQGSQDNMNMPATTFASAKITLDGKESVLIAVVVRGSGDTGDWLTNFHASFDGFFDAADMILDRFKAYHAGLSEYYGFDVNIDNTVLMITGHSQGGAIAGQLGKQTVGWFGRKDRVFAYTFASPKYQTFNDDTGAYTNIHNIINGWDSVPDLPPGYKRYGRDSYFGDAWDIVNVKNWKKMNVVDHHLLSTHLEAMLNHKLVLK